MTTLFRSRCSLCYQKNRY